WRPSGAKSSFRSSYIGCKILTHGCRIYASDNRLRSVRTLKLWGNPRLGTLVLKASDGNDNLCYPKSRIYFRRIFAFPAKFAAKIGLAQETRYIPFPRSSQPGVFNNVKGGTKNGQENDFSSHSLHLAAGQCR